MRITLDVDFFEHGFKIKREWLSFRDFLNRYYLKLFSVWGYINKLKFWYRIVMGLILIRKLPEIRVTNKGLHFVWRGLKYSERRMLLFRLILGDDINRIALDFCSKNRIKQVLFCEKKVYIYDRGIRKIPQNNKQNRRTFLHTAQVK